MLQLAASGLSDSCCAGVRSCQAGFKEGLGTPAVFISAFELADLEEAGASGVATAPLWDQALEIETLKTAATQTALVLTSAPVQNSRLSCLVAGVNSILFKLLSLSAVQL